MPPISFLTVETRVSREFSVCLRGNSTVKMKLFLLSFECGFSQFCRPRECLDLISDFRYSQRYCYLEEAASWISMKGNRAREFLFYNFADVISLMFEFPTSIHMLKFGPDRIRRVKI